MVRATLPTGQADKEAKTGSELMEIVAKALQEVPGAPNIPANTISIASAENSGGRWSIGIREGVVGKNFLDQNQKIIDQLQEKYRVV